MDLIFIRPSINIAWWWRSIFFSIWLVTLTAPIPFKGKRFQKKSFDKKVLLEFFISCPSKCEASLLLRDTTTKCRFWSSLRHCNIPEMLKMQLKEFSLLLFFCMPNILRKVLVFGFLFVIICLRVCLLCAKRCAKIVMCILNNNIMNNHHSMRKKCWDKVGKKNG